MHSSGENSRKRKNDSDKRGGYWKFDEASSRMRESLIKSCAERVIDHAASNGGETGGEYTMYYSTTTRLVVLYMYTCCC